MASLKFMDMVKELVTELFNDDLNKIKAQCSNQKTFKDLFAFIWDLEDAEQILKTNLVVSEKSENEADKLRKSGNEHFKKKKYELALRDYNLSIMNAAHPVIKGSEDRTKTESHDFPSIDPAKYGGTEEKCNLLAVGFANRSAVMFEMRLYEACLNDIALALEYGYPEAFRVKLYQRKVTCLNQIDNSDLSEKKSDYYDSESTDTASELPFDASSTDNSSEIANDGSATDRSSESPIDPNIKHTSSRNTFDSGTTDTTSECSLDSSANLNGKSPVDKSNSSEFPLDAGATDHSSESPIDSNVMHNSSESRFDSEATDKLEELPLDACATDHTQALPVNENATDKSGETLLDTSSADISWKSSFDLCDIEKTLEELLGAGSTVNSDEFVESISSTDNSEESPRHVAKFSFSKTKAKKKEPSPTIPFSDSIHIAFKPSKGRCLIAARDLKPGELLLTEEAFSLSLDTPHLRLHCCTCLRICLNPLPCPGCTQVIFCSESCRTKGLSEDHWIECKILPTLISKDLINRNLAIKMLRTLSYAKLNDLIDNFQKETTKPAEVLEYCCNDGVYESESYRSVYHLCTNKDHLSFVVLFSQCVVSHIFIQLLQQSGRFFVDDDGNPVSPTREAVIMTGATLISHLVKLHCNPFQIWYRSVKKSIGTGLFPLLSLLNHSCYPNVRHYSNRRAKMLRAMRPIRAGEELTISYSLEFGNSPIEERREFLEKYRFTCACEACENKWPTFEYLHIKRFKCLECKLPLQGYLKICSACMARYSNHKAKKIMHQRKEEIDCVGNIVSKAIALDKKFNNDASASEEDYFSICEYIGQLDNHLQMPCQVMLTLQNILSKCCDYGF